MCIYVCVYGQQKYSANNNNTNNNNTNTNIISLKIRQKIDLQNKNIISNNTNKTWKNIYTTTMVQQPHGVPTKKTLLSISVHKTLNRHIIAVP